MFKALTAFKFQIAFELVAAMIKTLVTSLFLTISLMLVISDLALGQGQERAFPVFLEPLVTATLGKSQVIDAKDKKVPVKRGLKLRQRATIETEKNGWVQVSLTKNEFLIVGPSSRVILPHIQFEDGKVERIELQKGQLRLINHSSGARTVITEVSRDPYSEADLLFDFDPVKKSLQLVVFEGTAQFRGLEHENYTMLSEMEQSIFRGILEEGELAYDVLLHGRRVVRGTMSEKSKADPNLKETWISVFEKLDTQVKAAKKAEEKKVKGAICAKPQGKLNQCVWRCENNPKSEKKRCRVEKAKVKCVRERCDAQGRWSDRIEIIPSQSPCQVAPVVRACDY